MALRLAQEECRLSGVHPTSHAMARRMPLRIAVLGGGPGGLFAATLAKASDPARSVTVFERNRAEDTFGFGVVFSDATLEGIHGADPLLRTALAEQGVHWDAIEVRLRGERFRCSGNGMAAVGRRTLLQLLQQRAIDAGVKTRFSTPVDLEDLLSAGYDLVVAADGANSRMQEHFADVFGPTIDTAAAKFIWLGTTYPFEGLTFVHQRGPHGVFAVHGYPIGGGVSTFIVETDETSWRSAGLDGFDTSQPPGVSDEASHRYLEELFAGQIDAHPLLVNNSRWANFRTTRTARWWHRYGTTAVVLLGDAAHTAHFSVGSGTKMAMEDAAALARSLDAHPSDLDAALGAYEAERRPQVARIQGAARPSLAWWEHFGRTYDHLPPWQFAYHFFTRSLPESKLAIRDPGFVTAAHARWRAIHGAKVLDTPLDLAGTPIPNRLVTIEADAVVAPGGPLPLRRTPRGGSGPWALLLDAPDREAGVADAVEAMGKMLARGPTLVAVRGGTPLTRRLLCEAARLEHATPALLVEPGTTERIEDVALTAVLSGRADLVGVEDNGSYPSADPGAGMYGSEPEAAAISPTLPIAPTGLTPPAGLIAPAQEECR